MRLVTGFWLFASLIICNGCNGSDDEDRILYDVSGRHRVEFDIVSCPAKSGHSEIDNKVEAAVQNPHQFRELYLSIDPTNQDDVPSIDFNEKIAIVLYMGRQTSSAPEIRMGRVTETEHLINVEYEEMEATVGCLGDSAIMYPYCIITIDQTDKEIQFSAKTSGECGTG